MWLSADWGWKGYAVCFKNTKQNKTKKHDLEAANVIDGEGNSNPLQYSCLENSMDGEAW